MAKITPDKAKTPTISDLERLVRKDDDVTSKEPKSPKVKDAKHFLDADIEAAVFENGSVWSLVVVSSSGRSHSWGPEDKIKASAKHLGLLPE